MDGWMDRWMTRKTTHQHSFLTAANDNTHSGRAAEGVVHAAVFCQQCGICLTYFIFVGTNARDLLTNLFGVADPPSLSSLCYWQLLLFIPLVMIRDIEQFTYTNMVANVAILYSVLVLSAFAAAKASACIWFPPSRFIHRTANYRDPCN